MDSSARLIKPSCRLSESVVNKPNSVVNLDPRANTRADVRFNGLLFGSWTALEDQEVCKLPKSISFCKNCWFKRNRFHSLMANKCRQSLRGWQTKSFCRSSLLMAVCHLRECTVVCVTTGWVGSKFDHKVVAHIKALMELVKKMPHANGPFSRFWDVLPVRRLLHNNARTWR